MKGIEKIPVFVRIERGITVCVCHVAKRCARSRDCHRDVLLRDRFDGWKSTMRKDRYGR